MYLKNNYNTKIKINEASDLGNITNLSIDKEKVYLAINGTHTPTLTISSVGYADKTVKWISNNDSIVSVDSNGKIKGLKKGNTKVIAKVMDKEVSIDVVVTNLITLRPKEFNNKKKYLSCNIYSKEDNDLLDEILKDRINTVGYKTRAGVVEAARFLTLHFPYKIEYFYENGRLGTNGIDGEGRYYHKGLYLNSSKYSTISKSKNGPKVWGCSLYSTPVKHNDNNGLDCSGFVSWALLNGGFNPGDLGAGFTSTKNLTDLGNLKKITKSLIESNKIKAGDLVHNYEATGHIGIIIGIDKYNYYVAQAIWYDDNGVTVTKVSKSYMPTKFPHVVLMDDYYKKDGNYTEMW